MKIYYTNTTDFIPSIKFKSYFTNLEAPAIALVEGSYVSLPVLPSRLTEHYIILPTLNVL